MLRTAICGRKRPVRFWVPVTRTGHHAATVATTGSGPKRLKNQPPLKVSYAGKADLHLKASSGGLPNILDGTKTLRWPHAWRFRCHIDHGSHEFPPVLARQAVKRHSIQAAQKR